MWSPAKPDELKSFRLRRNTTIPNSSLKSYLLTLSVPGPLPADPFLRKVVISRENEIN